MITCLILGSGGAVPTPTRSPAAYWLTIDGIPILMDSGPGASLRLTASPDGPDSLDALDTLLFSHFHLDHCADLPTILFALHGPVTVSERPLQLIGPVGLKNYVEGLRTLYGPWLDPLRRPLVLTEVSPGDQLIPVSTADRHWDVSIDAQDTTRVEIFAADHSESRFSRENLLFRFRDKDGYTLVYSGDSQPCADLETAARGVDCLLVECSIPDTYAAPGHMTPERVGRLCRHARPADVVLTHLYPACDALDIESIVAEHFDGPVVRARDGMLLTVPDDD